MLSFSLVSRWWHYHVFYVHFEDSFCGEFFLKSKDYAIPLKILAAPYPASEYVLTQTFSWLNKVWLFDWSLIMID